MVGERGSSLLSASFLFREAPGSKAERWWVSTRHLFQRRHVYKYPRRICTVSVLLASSPHPAGDWLTIMCASPAAGGSPLKVWSENETGGWAGVGSQSGAGDAALCAGSRPRLPGLYCRGGETHQNLDTWLHRTPSTPAFPGNPTPQKSPYPRIPILSPPLPIPGSLPRNSQLLSQKLRSRPLVPLSIPSFLCTLLPLSQGPKDAPDPMTPECWPQPGDSFAQGAHHP